MIPKECKRLAEVDFPIPRRIPLQHQRRARPPVDFTAPRAAVYLC